LLIHFNQRLQRKYGLSRLQKFEQGEKILLQPLPTTNFESGTWKKVQVHPDCHVQVAKNFYSAPYTLRGKELDARVTSGYVEIFHQLQRIAVHDKASAGQYGRYYTKKEHLPEAQNAILEFTPQHALKEADSIGVSTSTIVGNLLQKSRHPLQYLRRVQGILRLKRRYTAQALEEACDELLRLAVEMPRLTDVEEMIKSRSTRQLRKGNLEIVRKFNPNLRGQQSWS
jgi:hypothetical protein